MRFLVTRPQPDCRTTADRLRALGHSADEVPLLEFKPEPPADIDLSKLGAVAITSRRAVDALMGHPQFPSMLSLPVFTVGGKTAAACRAAGFKTVRSAESDVEGLAAVILASREAIAGSSVFYPAARDRAGNLGGRLQAAGISCQTVAVYRMEPADTLPDHIARALEQGMYDGALVFSRRTAETFATLLKANGLGHIFSSLLVYAISRQAAAGLEGFENIHVATAPREDALIDLVLAEC
jgi:uroporphyrinogen-III synthase